MNAHASRGAPQWARSAAGLVALAVLPFILADPGPRALAATAVAESPIAIVSHPPPAVTDSRAGADYIGRILADPSFEGRGAGTVGIDSAATFLARIFAASRLLPGGDDGTYFQPFEITTGVRVGEPGAVQVGDSVYAVGDDMQPIGFSTNGTLQAPVVFAGYGVTAPGLDYDDYADLDVAGKIVLVFTQEPGEMDTTSRFNGDINTAHAESRTKAINAREHGALGLLLVNGPKNHQGEVLPSPRGSSTGYMTSGLLAARVSERVAEQLLKGSSLTLEALQDAIDAHTKPHSMALKQDVKVTVTLERTRAHIRNVVGWIRGQDTTRTLVLGAHYDHLGYGGEGSLAPGSHAPHLGADDNASGVSALMVLADHFAREAREGRTPRHNLVFCAFAGEESGLLGSSHFVDQPIRPVESIETMINLDMVGRLKANHLIVMGGGTAEEFHALLENLNRSAGFDLKTLEDGFGPSDHTSFYKRKIPVLSMFTGVHTDYHKPSDTWDKINVDGIMRIVTFVAATVESVDARPPATYRAGAVAHMSGIGGGGGYGAYLGTIPDYVQTEGGVLLSGVRGGAPADQAGIRGGDTIIKFDGVRIDNIYDYTYALRSRKPDQKVHITLLRDGKEVEVIATLGRRMAAPPHSDNSDKGGHP